MTLWQKFTNSVSRSEKAAPKPSGAVVPVVRPSSPTGAASGTFTWTNKAGGSDRQWRTEAGRLQDNSAVSVLLGTVCNNFSDAPLTIRRFNPENGAYEIQPEHPLAALLKRPNPYWTRTHLFKALLTSLYLDGNAYLFKARNSMGTVVELWWMPHQCVTVLTDAAGFVTGFKYKVKSAEVIYSPEDVVHLKMGVNTDRPELGESPLLSVLREICTDNEVLNYTFAILKNVGVPGVILSPKVVKRDEEDEIPEVTPSLVQKVKELWTRLTTGDARGEPIVMTMPWDVSVPGFKPSELLLDKVGQLAETRIAGVFGVPVVVVQFLSGLQNTNAKASYQEAIQQLYGCCLIPLQREICEWLDLQLLYELGDPEKEHFWFDRSEIAALQENVSELWNRADKGFNSGWLKRSESRQIVGYDTDDSEDDGYKPDLYAVAAPATGEVTTTDTAPTSADGTPEAGVVTSQTLNGAQIQAALSVVEQIRLGLIPVEVGIELIVAVGLPRDRAEVMANAIEVQPATTPEPTPDPTDEEQRAKAALSLAKRWKQAGLEAPEVALLS